MTPFPTPVAFPGFLAKETRAYDAALTVKMPGWLALEMNRGIVELRSCGAWDKLDIFYMFWLHDSQAAKVNIKNPGTYTLTEQFSPVFTQYRQYKGDSSSILNTGFVPNTAGGNWTLTSALLGTFVVEEAIADGTAGDVGSTGGLAGINTQTVQDCATMRINHVLALSGGNDGTAIGNLAIAQVDADSVRLYCNGSVRRTIDGGELGTPTAMPNAQISALQFNSVRAQRGVGAMYGGGWPGDHGVRAIDNALLRVGHAVGANTSGAPSGLTARMYDFGLNLSTLFMYSGSVRSSYNNHIYGIPNQATALLDIDATGLIPSGDFETFGVTLAAGVSKFVGGVEDAEDWIWCVPNNSDKIFGFNPRTGETVYDNRGLTWTPANAYSGGYANAAKTRIAFVPNRADTIIFYDVLTHTWSQSNCGLTLTLNDRKYGGGVVDAYDILWCAPFVAQKLLAIDLNATNTAYLTTLDLGGDIPLPTLSGAVGNCFGGARSGSGKIILSAFDGENFIVIEPDPVVLDSSAHYTDMGLNNGEDTGRWNGAICVDDQMIFTPLDARDTPPAPGGAFCIADPDAETAVRTWLGADVWNNGHALQGASLGPDKYIWMMSQSIGKIARVGPFSTDVADGGGSVNAF